MLKKIIIAKYAITAGIIALVQLTPPIPYYPKETIIKQYSSQREEIPRKNIEYRIMPAGIQRNTKINNPYLEEKYF